MSIQKCVLLLAFVTIVGFAQFALGQTVLQNSNLSFNELGNGSQQEFTLQQDIAGTDPTSITFSISNSNTLVFGGSAVDEASDWYLVEPGELLSIDTTTAGLNDLWGTGLDPANFLDPPNNFTVPTPFFELPYQLTAQSEIFLGFTTTTSGLDFPESPADRNVFGWVELAFIGFGGPGEPQSIDGLFVLESAIAYDASGIVVGTTQATAAVPEPSAAFLFGLGGIFAGCRRRRSA